MRLIWLLAALVCASVLSYLQHEALANFWYWDYPWFDTLMHFIGGLALSTFIIALLDKHRAFLFLAGMLAVAIGWELFELLINTQREANFAFDTSLDLLMDALGMTLGYVVARFTIWRSA